MQICTGIHSCVPFHKCSSAGCKVFFILLIFAAKIFILASVKNNLDLLIGLVEVVFENVRKLAFFPACCSFSVITVARIMKKNILIVLKEMFPQSSLCRETN